MKTKITQTLLAFIFVGIAFTSCKKDAVLNNEQLLLESKPIVVEDGYLRFRDQIAFDSVINIILQQRGLSSIKVEGFKSYREVFDSIEKEYLNVQDNESFESFKNKYSSLVKIKSDSSITYKFGTPLSALFTNQKGEVKIGKTKIIYSEDGKYLFETSKGKTSNKDVSVQGYPVNGPTSTSAIKSELYYNDAHTRRLFVDLWLEFTPRTDSDTGNPVAPLSRYYFSSRQELKKTFGGWRTNETNYHFENLNYNYTVTRTPMLPYNQNYTLGYHAIYNVTGPVIIDLGLKEGYLSNITGSGKFSSGGVLSTPLFIL